MKDYIEREKVFNDLLDQCKITGYGGLTANDVKYVFSLQVNADVRPVVHGEWLHLNQEFDYGRCSVCGYELRRTGAFYFCPHCGADIFDYDRCPVCGYEPKWSEPFYFCPNCGADMRGGS